MRELIELAGLIAMMIGWGTLALYALANVGNVAACISRFNQDGLIVKGGTR